jgi:hypothetical protein
MVTKDGVGGIAALLARDKHPARIWDIVPALSLVYVNAFDPLSGERLGLLNEGGTRMTIINRARLIRELHSHFIAHITTQNR